MNQKKKRNPFLSAFCPYPGKREILYHLGLCAGFDAPDDLVDELLKTMQQGAKVKSDLTCENNQTGQIVVVYRVTRTPYACASFN